MNDDDLRKREQADALVGGIRRESAGRLTVFLGAAPGVGKTYAMLTRAHELRRQGVDVVAGVLETHGRSETEHLTRGLEVLPRQSVSYQGHTLEEMALDQLLKRHPQVALVDELAHRNAPGSRHERRWQDVEELLDAGIDVYTTLNIQHLESLNDVVHQITGVRVTETVPDRVFDRLRDIRLVDLPARELIERLAQGKVYVPEQATRALGSFFTPGNLTALRELAMQTVAGHVDSDLRETTTARGQRVFVRRHVLIAIDGMGQSQSLVRAGSRMAERRGATWTVVYVARDGVLDSSAEDKASRRDTSGSGTQPLEGRNTEADQQLEVDRAFALARRLGGETALVHGSDVASALLDAAVAQGATAILLGRTRERPVARIFNRTITQQLLRRGAGYELTIVSPPAQRARARRALSLPLLSAAGLLPGNPGLVLLCSMLAVLAAWSADRWLDLQDVSMIFMLAVLIVAVCSRMASSVATALLCFFSYNFFFIAPRYSLNIAASQGLANVAIFLAAAVIAGHLASRLRRQVLALRAANAHAAVIQSLARKLSVAADLAQVLKVGQAALQSTLGASVWMKFGDRELPSANVAANTENGNDGSNTEPSGKDLSAADWTLRHGQPSGRHTDTLSASRWWFLPMTPEEDTVGVAGLHMEGVRSLTAEQRRLAEAMVADIGQAALRTTLVDALEAARVSSETERLRTALLSSVSHDLRSPLSSMIGAADSLTAYGESMSKEDRVRLLASISNEGQRLDRYIQNLLDMTRLGQQGLAIERDWIGVDELIASATRRLQRHWPAQVFDMKLPPGLAPIHVHPALLEQALFNVLENAARFSPEGKPVVIAVQADPAKGLLIDVTDQGPGIPPEERSRVFDMFYSVTRGDRSGQGTGLGLAIVQAIIGAHMGKVEAFDGQGGHGTLIRITLPPSVFDTASVDNGEDS